MSPAPVGKLVRITYDSDRELAAGHYLVTGTGRTYRIVSARVVRDDPMRWAVGAIVDALPPPADATRHPLIWHRRARGARRSRGASRPPPVPVAPR